MDNLLYIYFLIPIIIFLVNIAIKIGFPRKLSPIASLLFSIIPSVLFFAPGDLIKGIEYAILITLCTSGFVSSYKNITEYIAKKNK